MSSSVMSKIAVLLAGASGESGMSATEFRRELRKLVFLDELAREAWFEAELKKMLEESKRRDSQL